MRWTRLLKRYGYQVEETGAEYDPFALLAAQSQASGTPNCTISYNLGTSREYGEVRCGVNITIHCPQNESSINMAAELAFRKGVELTNDGASHLGIPGLTPPGEP